MRKFDEEDILIHQEEMKKPNPVFWVVEYISVSLNPATGLRPKAILTSYQCRPLDDPRRKKKSIPIRNEKYWHSVMADQRLKEKFAEYII